MQTKFFYSPKKATEAESPTCYTILSMLLWGSAWDVACSHSEGSVILPKQDIFLHHVVAQSPSAWRLASFLKPPRQHQVEKWSQHM